MASKRPVRGGGSETIRKRQKKVMTLIEKVNLLDMLNSGASASAVGRHFGINESTVRSIKKNASAIRESVANSAPLNAKTITVVRDKSIEKMEKALSVWIEDQTQQNILISGPIIRSEAKRLFDHFKAEIKSDDAGTSTEFHASKGWFERFKNRQNLQSVKLVGESASADYEAAQRFPEEFLKTIEEKRYRPEQVFNADETGLFWKKTPKRTFLSIKERTAQGFKTNKDRITLLLCANASGDCMVKPMLLNRALNPRALKGKNKCCLPVFWRANKKACVTETIFLEWFHNCFVHEVKAYLETKKMAFKVLLLIDSAPGHPVDIQFAHPNVEVMFLPPNTTSLIQPLDQGVIAVFKTYYTRHFFTCILDAMEADPTLEVDECWKKFNIADCIRNIKDSLVEVKPATVNACWKKLWPAIVNDFNSIPSVADEAESIVRLAREIRGEGFDDMEVREVEELVQSHNEELGDGEQEELIQNEGCDCEESSDEEDDRRTTSLNSKVLKEIMQLKRAFIDKVVQLDPIMERSLKFKREVEAATLPYVEIQKDLQNRTEEIAITNFFKSKK